MILDQVEAVHVWWLGEQIITGSRQEMLHEKGTVLWSWLYIHVPTPSCSPPGQYASMCYQATTDSVLWGPMKATWLLLPDTSHKTRANGSYSCRNTATTNTCQPSHHMCQSLSLHNTVNFSSGFFPCGWVCSQSETYNTQGEFLLESLPLLVMLYVA